MRRMIGGKVRCVRCGDEMGRDRETPTSGGYDMLLVHMS